MRQLRVVAAPARRAVFEALLEGPLSAGEVARRTGLSAESAHYHLGLLRGIGLVEERAPRRTGARPEKVFGLRFESIELRRGRRSREYIKELVRATRRLLRTVEREYERAWEGDPEPEAAPRVARMIGRLTPEDVAQIEQLERRMSEVVRRANRRAAGSAGLPATRVAVTAIMAPLIDR